MPRILNPDLLIAMNSGHFTPYFNVQLMDEDRTSVQFETTEVVEFELNGLSAKIVFHDPEYWDDYYMFRIQRGIIIDGVPNIITSSCYWPTYDRHENFIRTIQGHVFPSKYFTTPGDVTYASIINTVCAEFGFSVVHEDPAAAWLDYQFLPDDITLVLNDTSWFFILLRQKYLIFATDYDDDTLYFFQAKATGPTFPDDYTLLQTNHISITGHGAFKEKTLFSRDENSAYHYTGGTDKPIHNLGFLHSTASHPDNYSFIDTQNWIIQNIAPNLKYLDFDPIYVVLDFGEFSIWPSKFVELYGPNYSPTWQWQVKFLDVFGTTEGGSIPDAIRDVAPFIPLSTLNFDKNLDESVTNLQALAEAVDELTTLTGSKYVLHSLSTIINDVLVGSGVNTFVRKTITEFKAILGLATDYVAHNLSQSANDVLVGSGSSSFIRKTLTEFKALLGIDTGPYTPASGWIEATDTWTRTSATSFTVPGDKTTTLHKGTKIKCYQSGTKYGVVALSTYSSPTTTVNLIPNDDYSLAAAAITLPCYSYIEHPQSWPDWFDYSPVWTASGAMTFTVTTLAVAKWQVLGHTCHVIVIAEGTTGGTVNYSIQATAPIIGPDYSIPPIFTCNYRDDDTGRPIVGTGAIETDVPRLRFRTQNATIWSLGDLRQVMADAWYEI